MQLFGSEGVSARSAIQGLREIDEIHQPNTCQSAVGFIVECYTYDIKDAYKKTGLQRMIGRKFSKAGKREIPNLMDPLAV